MLILVVLGGDDNLSMNSLIIEFRTCRSFGVQPLLPLIGLGISNNCFGRPFRSGVVGSCCCGFVDVKVDPVLIMMIDQ